MNKKSIYIIIAIIIILLLTFIGVKIYFSNNNECMVSDCEDSALLENKIKNLNTLVNNTKAEKEQLQTKLAEINDTINQFDNKINELNNKLTTKDKNINTLKEKINNLEQEKSKLINEEELLTTKISALENEINGLLIQINSLKTELDNLKNTYTVFYSINGSTVGSETVKKGQNLKNKPTKGPDNQTIQWKNNVTNVTSNIVLQGTYYCNVTFSSAKKDGVEILSFDTDSINIPCGSVIYFDDDKIKVFSEDVIVTATENGDSIPNKRWKIEDDDYRSGSYYIVNKPINIEGYDGGCVIEGTKITLANGLTKNVEDIKVNDEILTYNRFEGKLLKEKVTALVAGHSRYASVITLEMEKNIKLEIVDYEYIFDMDSRKYIIVDDNSYKSLVGKNVMINNNGEFAKAKILSAKREEREVNHYTIYSEGSNNYIANNVITKTATYWVNDFITIGEDYKIDTDIYQRDLEKYGLYTYDEVKSLISYDLYKNYNIGHLKFIEGKGIASRDVIFDAIKEFSDEFNN